jgi:hypothetical protein
MNIPKPQGFYDWPEPAQAAYLERVCIMREGNRIRDDAPTPEFIDRTAREEAEAHRKAKL